MVQSCCLQNCTNTNKDASMHRIPKDINRFNAWITKIGRLDLLKLPIDRVNKSYMVCGAHFSKKQKIPIFNKNRTPLLRNAVPDLHLPFESETLLDLSPDDNDQESPAKTVQSDHNYPFLLLNHEISLLKKPEPLEDFLTIKCTHICLFCMKVLEKTNEINIQMSVTTEGRIMEDFIRTSLLYIGVECSLESYFICLACNDLVNEYEEYFNKCHAIQDSLMLKYVGHRNFKNHSYSKDDANVQRGELPVFDFPIICDNKEFSTKASQTKDYQYLYEERCIWDSIKDLDAGTNMKKDENVQTEENTDDFYEGGTLVTNPVMIKRLKKEKEERLKKQTAKKKIKPPPSSNGYCCHRCGKIYWRYSLYKRHEDYHKNEGRYRCEVCNKTFALRANYNKHTLTHTDHRPYQCESCEKAFRSLRALNLHKLSRHPTAEDMNRFCCDQCGQVYTSAYGFRVHLLKHKEVNKYRCDLCNKTFVQRGSLKRHNLIHLGVRPFKCELCQKDFKTNHELTQHMNRHNGIRNYRCDKCDKTFVTRPNLRNHMNIHLDVKPFPCPICARRFAIKTNMKSHMKTHFKEKKERKVKNKKNN